MLGMDTIQNIFLLDLTLNSEKKLDFHMKPKLRNVLAPISKTGSIHLVSHKCKAIITRFISCYKFNKISFLFGLKNTCYPLGINVSSCNLKTKRIIYSCLIFQPMIVNKHIFKLKSVTLCVIIKNIHSCGST